MELVYNGGATPDIWQETALGDQTTVWQTNTDDGFCTDTTFCTFLEFKEEYATARFFGVQVGIGTGVPPVTSYADGVSMTIVEDGTEITDTWDFDVAAAPTPTAAPPDPAPATPVRPPGRRSSRHRDRHYSPTPEWASCSDRSPSVGRYRRDRSEAPPQPLTASAPA